VIAAGTSWPEAAISIAGIALVGSVVVVVIRQALATARARIAEQLRATTTLLHDTLRSMALSPDELATARRSDGAPERAGAT
jgi:hypothetical protein